MAWTQSDLLLAVRHKLGEKASQSTYLTNDVNKTTATIPVSNGSMWSTGSIVEFQPDGEQALVLSDPPSNSLNVRRGYNGTAAVAHSNNDEVLRDPLWTIKRIETEAINVIGNLWPNVWTYSDYVITPDKKAQWYDLPEDSLNIIKVMQQAQGSQFSILFYGEKWTWPVRYENIGKTLAYNGPMIQFPAGFYNKNDVTVRYLRKIVNTPAFDGYEDLEDPDLRDYVAAATGAKLLMYRDVQRTAAQDATQGDQSIQPGMRFQIGTGLRKEADQILYRLQWRCWDEFPPLRRQRIR